jgi:cytochrome P450
MSGVETPPYLAGKVRVTSYAAVNEILRNPDFGAGRTEEESLPFRGRTLLELDGDEHRERRRIENPLFGKPVLDRYEEDVLAPAIERCLADADASRDADGVVRADLVRLSHSMFVQIAAALIGLDGVDTAARTALLEDCMYPLNDAFDVKYSTRDHAEVVAEGLAAKARFVEHFYRPSAERRADLLARHDRGELAEEDLPSDLLTILLRHHGADWDGDLPVREAILFLAGSTSTTSNAVNHAVVDLLGWLGEHPEDRAHLDDAAFLRGVCNEALRLHQNVTALVRRATKDVTLSTGLVIGAGEFVAVDTMAANRDPAAFGADADRFNPWREVAAAVRPYGLSFGTGRHVCIGLPLVTPISGKPSDGEGGAERAMLKILRALLAAGIELDPERPPTLLPTVEDVHASLPVLLAAR